VLRPDTLVQGLTVEQALAAAPAAEDGRFRVPRILDSE
jgi:aspartyl-tRNA(Asn)/glutamyl-tRNA(Gln) amidotransferase subunit C